MFNLLGIDVGSTTVKVTVINPETDEILYKSYERHFSKVKECVLKELEKISDEFGNRYKVCITAAPDSDSLREVR